MRASTLAIAALAALPGTLAAQEIAAPKEVVALSIEGERIFPEEQLLTAIETRATGCRLPAPLSWIVCPLGIAKEREYLANPAVLDSDALRLRLFYFQRGYREAVVSVETRPAGDGIAVTFRIEEGRPVRVASLVVEGAEGFLPDDIDRQLPLRTGDPLSLIVVEAARDSLVNAMRNRGYPRAEALIDQIFIPTGSRDAEVRFVVIPGTHARFGPIEITGDERISEDIIRRMLTFREGAEYRQDALITSQRNLFGLNVFQNVSIQPVEDAASDSIIPVRVQVNEGDIHRIRFGVGANTLDCLNAEASWTSRNFLGGARRLELRGLVANVLAEPLHELQLCHTEDQVDADDEYLKIAGAFSVDFSQPWFLGPRNTLGAGLFIERRSLPGVFIRHARGGYIGITRTLSSRTAVSLGYRAELTRLDAAGGDLFYCVSLPACAVSQIDVLSDEDEDWLNPVTLSFTRDRTNSFFSPSRGYIFHLETEYAAPETGSEFAYARIAGDLSWYRGLGSGVIFATRLRAGLARSLGEPGEAEGLGLNPQKRFFAGGANSVRGFPQYRLGPQVLWVDAQALVDGGCSPAQINAGECDPSVLGERFQPDPRDIRPVGGDRLLEGSVELRFPLAGERWRGAAFVDYGQVWQHGAGDPFRPDELVFTPGLGIRYNSPIGPIRVDVGYNTQGEESLPVITTEIDENGDPTNDLRDQLEFTWKPEQRFPRFWDRLQFHFSIGQAF